MHLLYCHVMFVLLPRQHWVVLIFIKFQGFFFLAQLEVLVYAG